MTTDNSGKVLVFRKPETYVRDPDRVPEFNERLDRIRSSLDKINQLMAELKTMNKTR